MGELDEKQITRFDTEGENTTPKEVEDEQKNMDEDKTKDTVDMESPIEPKEEVDMETPAEETTEKPEVEVEVEVGKRDDEQGEEPEDSSENEAMSSNAYADVPAMLAMLGAETEQTQQMFAEMDKQEKDFSVISNGLYFMLKKFAEKCMALEEEKTKREEEMSALKTFKQDVENKEFQRQVEATLDSVKEFASEEEREEWLTKSKAFSIQTIGEWEKEIKSYFFSVVTKKVNSTEKNGDAKITVMRLPFNEQKKQDNKHIW
jgi:hypothetical protein